METPEYYRKRAEQCRSEARMRQGEGAAIWTRMAEEYDRLAAASDVINHPHDADAPHE